MSNYKFIFAGLVTVVLTMSGCHHDSDSGSGPDSSSGSGMEMPEKNIVEVAVEADNLTTLVTALQATGLDSVLQQTDTQFTVFAPTDAAFALLGEDTINALLGDTDTLSDILLYHVVSGAEIGSSAAIASAGQKLVMANEDELAVSLSGSSLYLNLSMVTVTDIEASNGIIHVIDAVLMPPSGDTMSMDSIADIAVASDSFTTLVAALQAADLVATLDDESASYTVFAPTDAAFDLLGAETIEALLADTDALSAILLQHVLVGAVDSVTAFTLNGETAVTASGVGVDIVIAEGKLMVGGANVVMTDIYASNGIIHVIDTVITQP